MSVFLDLFVCLNDTILDTSLAKINVGLLKSINIKRIRSSDNICGNFLVNFAFGEYIKVGNAAFSNNLKWWTYNFYTFIVLFI